MPSRCLLGKLYLLPLPLPFTTARCLDNVFFVQDQKVGFDAGYDNNFTSYVMLNYLLGYIVDCHAVSFIAFDSSQNCVFLIML